VARWTRAVTTYVLNFDHHSRQRLLTRRVDAGKRRSKIVEDGADQVGEKRESEAPPSQKDKTKAATDPKRPFVSAQIKAILLSWVNLLIRRASSAAACSVRTITCPSEGACQLSTPYSPEGGEVSHLVFTKDLLAKPLVDVPSKVMDGHVGVELREPWDGHGRSRLTDVLLTKEELGTQVRDCHGCWVRDGDGLDSGKDDVLGWRKVCSKKGGREARDKVGQGGRGTKMGRRCGGGREASAMSTSLLWSR
jgi:hypothetical protein